VAAAGKRSLPEDARSAEGLGVIAREIFVHADARDGKPKRAIERLSTGVAAEDIQSDAAKATLPGRCLVLLERSASMALAPEFRQYV
jgi:hypothetical protein